MCRACTLHLVRLLPVVEELTSAILTSVVLGGSVLQARAQQLSLLLSVLDDTQKLFEMDVGILELTKTPGLEPPELEGPSCAGSPQRDDTSQPSTSRGASPMQQDDID